jgi:molybdopterin-guanine dinucleotide biosynthesis protein MobB
MVNEILSEQLAKLPILGICGFSGSGKTTLIETVLPDLMKCHLKVAVVKHGVHAVAVDRPGRDSDRLFRAGADVFLQGDETLVRLHDDDFHDLLAWLELLGKRYDLILVEGHKQSPLQKVWLLNDGESKPPADVTGIKIVLPRGQDRIGKFMTFLAQWLPAK